MKTLDEIYAEEEAAALLKYQSRDQAKELLEYRLRVQKEIESGLRDSDGDVILPEQLEEEESDEE